MLPLIVLASVGQWLSNAAGSLGFWLRFICALQLNLAEGRCKAADQAAESADQTADR